MFHLSLCCLNCVWLSVHYCVLNSVPYLGFGDLYFFITNVNGIIVFLYSLFMLNWMTFRLCPFISYGERIFYVGEWRYEWLYFMKVSFHNFSNVHKNVGHEIVPVLLFRFCVIFSFVFFILYCYSYRGSFLVGKCTDKRGLKGKTKYNTEGKES